MKGKGDVLTYWLVGTTDQSIKMRQLDLISKLRPLFSLPKLGVMNSCEVSRRERKSPRMSMASVDVRHSFRERNNTTPDSRRMSVSARISELPGGGGGSDSRAESPLLAPTDIVFNFDPAPPMSKVGFSSRPTFDIVLDRLFVPDKAVLRIRDIRYGSRSADPYL
jgi:hypothetical protein